MLRWALLGLAVLAIAATLLSGALAFGSDRGYFAPVFSHDGRSIYVIRRDVSATIVGFGHEFWTPPARVRIRRDRFALLNIRLADRQVTTVETFPPSPLEGTSLSTYHGAIYGVGRGYLRWADASHLEYFSPSPTVMRRSRKRSSAAGSGARRTTAG